VAATLACGEDGWHIGMERAGAKTMVHGSSVHPYGPTLVCEPFHRDGWVYEEKL
jgi:hypothetical protein